MRWFVEISSIGASSDPPVKMCVEAPQWQPALQKVRALRGDDGALGHFSIEVLDEGYRAVDPMTRLRYFVRKAPDDAPITTSYPSATPAPPVAKPEPMVDDRNAPPQMRPRMQTSPFGLVDPVETPPPPPASRPNVPPKKTTVQGMPAVAGVPVRKGTVPGMAAVTATIPAAGAAAAQAKTSAPKAAVVAHKVHSSREENATSSSPLTYREFVYVVAEGTTEDAAKTLLIDRLDNLLTSLGSAQNKFVQMAVFDHAYQERPQRKPLVTLAWKDWREETVLGFPGREGAAKEEVIKPALTKPEPIRETPAPAKTKSTPPPPSETPAPAKTKSTPPPARAVVTPAPTRASVPAPAAKPAATTPAPAKASIPAPAATTPAPAKASIPAPAATTPAPAKASIPAPAATTPAPAKASIPAPAATTPAPSATTPAPSAATPAPSAATPAPSKASIPAPAATSKGSSSSIAKASVPPPRVKTADEVMAELSGAITDLGFFGNALEGADFIVQLVKEKFPSEVVLLWFYDAATRELVLVRQTGGTTDQHLSRMPDKTGLAHAALRSQRAVVIPDAARDPRANEARWKTMGIEAKSAVVAPVMHAGKPYGLLEILNPKSGGRYGTVENNGLTYLGQQLAEFISSNGVILDSDRILAGAKRIVS